eukprot:364817-Chlamydomonas_euryale.AAC.3
MGGSEDERINKQVNKWIGGQMDGWVPWDSVKEKLDQRRASRQAEVGCIIGSLGSRAGRPMRGCGGPHQGATAHLQRCQRPLRLAGSPALRRQLLRQLLHVALQLLGKVWRCGRGAWWGAWRPSAHLGRWGVADAAAQTYASV